MSYVLNQERRYALEGLRETLVDIMEELDASRNNDDDWAMGYDSGRVYGVQLAIYEIDELIRQIDE